MHPLKVVVHINQQTLSVIQDGRVRHRFPVSTSRYGTGFAPGSYRTPLGRFVIAEKIGDGQPPDTIFRGRLPVREESDWANEPDLITSRILWLDGLDPENANSKDRFIYIHGTNQEELLSTPASHGCIRMANADIIRLYEMVGPGTEVVIQQTAADPSGLAGHARPNGCDNSEGKA
ncbi:MAG TPA: L,D-transpeptidase [Chthoniobacterales bacterium]